MTKYIKQRLSVKIFIITFLLLGVACSGTYFFISKLLPVTYSNLINVSTEKAAMHLVEQMTAFDNISDCENDISNFSKETNAAFWIEDSNGRMIYPAEAYLCPKRMVQFVVKLKTQVSVCLTILFHICLKPSTEQIHLVTVIPAEAD